MEFACESVHQPLRQIAVGVNPAVAQEGPMGAGGIHILKGQLME